jgi:hypothetical protein
MSELEVHYGVAHPAWLQHHLPWLGLLAMVLNLFRDDTGIGFDPDDRNG